VVEKRLKEEHALAVRTLRAQKVCKKGRMGSHLVVGNAEETK
jgi:hypothetical protein